MQLLLRGAMRTCVELFLSRRRTKLNKQSSKHKDENIGHDEKGLEVGYTYYDKIVLFLSM